MDATNRIEALENPPANGHVRKSSRKSQAKPEAKPSPVTRRRIAAAERAVRWSHRYTALAIIVSSGLNAYASCQAAPTAAGQVAGAVLGAVVPVFVWGLAQLASWTYRAGWHRLALLPAGVSCVLLALSVTHCASAFAALTGTGLVLSGCLAVGIDCGLVASEATGILVSTAD